MPNQPKTSQRSFRIPDAEYAAAKAAAEFNGESLTDVVRRSLVGYTKRTDKKRVRDEMNAKFAAARRKLEGEDDDRDQS